MNKQFSGPVKTFHGLRLPEKAQPVGYTALIDSYVLSVPLPHQLYAIGSTHKILEEERWHLLTPRHTPTATLEGHLIFALKYEGINLAVINCLFEKIGAERVKALIEKTPTGIYARRLWFLYEWLTGETLSLPDLKAGNYVPVLDEKKQFALSGSRVTRQRVVNNLPGTPAFCPLIYKTPLLLEYGRKDLKERARKIINAIPADVMSRTAAFLLLKDSRSSYAIENETPPQSRIERWGSIIGQAGKNLLDIQELIRLQEIVIGDTRFVKTGLRKEGGFVGEHDRETGLPLPEHISAKPDDLPGLIKGLIDYASQTTGQIDPVIVATALAFGFVFIHPFSDGNGRLHRYLIHHVLAENGFNPPGLVFPVSAVLLDRIGEYRDVLQQYSSSLLPLIEWEPTKDNNVHVKNDTIDFYRYFDATPQAEFLYSCVERTIEKDLVEEAQFLQKYDRFKRELEEIVEMPSKTIDLLFRFLQQNKGKLSLRAREKEFKQLTGKEVEVIEQLYMGAFLP